MENIGMNDNNALHRKLLDIRDTPEILEEVKLTTSLINPQFDFQHLDKAFLDVEKLFRLHGNHCRDTALFSRDSRNDRDVYSY